MESAGAEGSVIELVNWNLTKVESFYLFINGSTPQDKKKIVKDERFWKLPGSETIYFLNIFIFRGRAHKINA
jgi:hypothetical protein